MPNDPISAQSHFVKQIRELAPLIDASVATIDATRDIPTDLFEQMVERDLFRLLQPRDIGGAQLTPPEFVRVLEDPETRASFVVARPSAFGDEIRAGGSQ